MRSMSFRDLRDDEMEDDGGALESEERRMV